MNPQNINTNWRPKSSIRLVNEKLESHWHVWVSKADIEETFRILAGLTEDSLLALSEDPENPILIRTVAFYLIKDWRRWIDAIDKVLDRAIGTTEAPWTVQNIMIITPEQEEFFSKMKSLGSSN